MKAYWVFDRAEIEQMVRDAYSEGANKMWRDEISSGTDIGMPEPLSEEDYVKKIMEGLK